MRPMLVQQFARRARGAARRTAYRLRDSLLSTYPADREDEPLARLIPDGLRLTPGGEDLRVAALILEHRFDLLGSGWVQVKPGMRCRGFEGIVLPASGDRAINPANARAAAGIAAMMEGPYAPIDWQRDFRSGFRWSERTGYRQIRYGGTRGADVKVPWELSRMQHLPELALVYSSTRDERLPREFRNELLDWLAWNPPRFGVNWACTMDVGIRVANWLLAFDMFRAAGARFDQAFERRLGAAVRAHAHHIVRNLEWSEKRRANHYLGNIAGLLFASAYLSGREADEWLAFAIQEMIVECERQFMADGAHFEASVAYHGLCAEMLAVCAVLVESLPPARVATLLECRPGRQPSGPAPRAALWGEVLDSHARDARLLPERFHARLHAAARFTHALTREDGSTPSVGDDDSGRFIRLGGWMDGGSLAECRERFANLAGFDELPGDARVPVMPAGQQAWLAWESALHGSAELLSPAMAQLWGNHRELAVSLVPNPRPTLAVAAEAPPVREARIPATTPVVVTDSLEFPGADLLDEVRHAAFPWFGIYVMRSRRLHLVVRCGDALRDGAGVHAHEDQLGIDLVVDGRVVCRDPGTFIYTASPELRARYRESFAHCAPAAIGEAETPPSAIFGPPGISFGQCRSFEAGRFEGVAELPGGAVIRTIQVSSQRVEIRDEYRLRPGWRPAHTAAFASARPVQFSPAYGVRLTVADKAG